MRARRLYACRVRKSNGFAATLAKAQQRARYATELECGERVLRGAGVKRFEEGHCSPSQR